MYFWWSVALAALGISGSLLVGMKLAVGWVVDIACEVLWLVYGIVTGQWGFCLSAMFFTAVYGRNLRLWLAPTPAVPPVLEDGLYRVEAGRVTRVCQDTDARPGGR